MKDFLLKKLGGSVKKHYLCSRKRQRNCRRTILHRGVEQLVARQAHNLEVARSSRASATERDCLRTDSPLLI